MKGNYLPYHWNTQGVPVMEPTLIALVALGVLASLVATIRLIRADRPSSPPSTFSDDWREEGLAWQRLGIG